MRLAAFTAAAALLLASVPARADDGDYGDEQLRDDRNLSLTLGVLGLLQRFLSGTAELNVAQPITVEATAGLVLGSPLAFGIGGGARGYFFGEFADRGTYAGLRALYLISTGTNGGFFGPASGLSIIPNVGGKVVRFGLTFDGSIGVSVHQAGGGWGAGLYLNAGVGYTF